mgnify:FL=1
MKITLLASFLVMAAYFLLLYAGVGLIQEKEFFSSAPREVFAAVPERKAERFRGAHILGWCLGILAMLLFLGAAVLAAWDGVRNGVTFGAFFARYLVILYVMEVYDILFFDWVLLCHSNFFPHFSPRSRASPPRSCSGTTKKRILRTFCSTSPSPPPSRGFARFSEGQFHIKT